jgi:hypothetical protein
LIALLSLCAFNAQAQQLSIPGLRAPEKSPAAKKGLPMAVRAARGEAPLSRLYDYVKVAPSKLRRLPALATREVQNPGPEKRLRIGEVRAFPQPIRVSSDSTLYRVAEGDVRVMGIVSEEARYTRVHFTGMSLPAGARVFVYSLKNPEEFYGPYEGRGPSNDGTFWTPPMEGDEVAIEYFSPSGATASQDAPFQVSEISHIFRDPLTKDGANDAAGSCNLDVATEWGEVAKSVGELQYTSGGSEYLCTGTLLNNQANDFTPYLLTANHCFSTQAEAQTLRVYWNYNSGDVPPAGTPHTDGANLLATGTGSDFTFVYLTGSLPGGLFFAGWDANPISAATPVTGIHHPKGSHKRISFGATNSSCASGLPGPCSSFTGVNWSSGTTEPGSSGSGIWTGTPSNPQFVGTLTGGNSSCATPTLSDYYGRFSITYPSIANFLIKGSGASCVSALSTGKQNFANTGGTGSISVTASGDCNWTATASHSFVNITSGTSGSGSGTVTFTVEANSGAYRTAFILVGTQVFTITQAGFSNGCGLNTITIGQTKNGALLTSDCNNPDGSYYDPYNFQGTAGQQIALSMTASFNSYLIVISPNGSILATDDDGGGGTNSRIPAGSGMITLPSTGPYTILASSSLPYATGSYALSLSGTALPTVTPAASISDVSIIEGNSDISFARFNISLSGPSSKSVCVQASTADGTATAGSDYFQVGGSITNAPSFIFFEPGVITATFTVQVRGDTLPEPDETFLANINPCNGDVTVEKGQAVGTIISDDLLSIKLMLDESSSIPSQAAAIDALLFLRDFFPVANAANLLNQSADKNTRVIVFVTNLQLAQSETASAVMVNLIGSNNQSYEVAAEDVRIVPGFNFTQVVFRLPDNLAPGTCTIKVKAHGQESNPGTIRIKS